VPKVVGCYALKGGVGKTSAAVNMAWLSSAAGNRTLLWDLDPQAASTFLLRVKAKVKGGTRKLLQGETDPHLAVKNTIYERLDLLPAQVLYQWADIDLDAAKKSEQRVDRVLRAFDDDYDVVVIDAPAGLSLLSSNIVRAADLLLVPIVPSPLSLRTLDQVVDLIATTTDATTRLVAFLSMVDARRPLHRDVIALVGDGYADVARTQIPASATVERMGQRRAPIVAWSPHSRAAIAYTELWSEVAQRLAVSPTGPASGG
jgi:chromosome partitioning protein